MGEIMQSAVSQRLQTHEEALERERKRFQVIDDAERAKRDEREKEIVRRAEEVDRIKQEQEAMMEWEAYQPPPTPENELYEITEFKATEDGEGHVVVLADGTEMAVMPDTLTALTEIFEQKKAEEGKRVLGKYMEGTDGVAYLDSFRLADALP